MFTWNYAGKDPGKAKAKKNGSQKDQSARSTNQGKLARCRNRKHTPVGVESSLANLLAMC